MPAGRVLSLGLLSGCHIGFGAFLMLSVGGACPGLAASNPGLKSIISGAFGLPFGLFMTLLTGAELFTGNTALVTMAMLEGKATLGQLTKSWTASYVGNLIGSIAFALLVSMGGTLVGGGASVGAAVAKTSLPFGQAFVRGLLCNWLVCMAVYLASFAKDVAGKVCFHTCVGVATEYRCLGTTSVRYRGAHRWWPSGSSFPRLLLSVLSIPSLTCSSSLSASSRARR